MKKLNLLLLSAFGALTLNCATGDYHHRYAGLQDNWSQGSLGIPDKGDSMVSKIVKRAVLKNDKIEISDNVLFETGSDHILPESHSLLDEVAAVLDNHPEVEHIRVEGHTDSQGNSDSNQTLSQKRAEAVRTYLIDNDGIDPARLEAEGFGDTSPIADNDTDEGRAQNRRVEFVVFH